jgi:preprotein translocase subunit SecB
MLWCRCIILQPNFFMEITKQSKLSFSGVDIKTFDFKSNKNFNFEVDPTIGIEAKLVNNNQDSTHVRVWMKIELLTELSEEDKKAFIHINTPPIMFPYMRALISTFTANCGDAVPLLIVPTQFFNGQLDSTDIE